MADERAMQGLVGGGLTDWRENLYSDLRIAAKYFKPGLDVTSYGTKLSGDFPVIFVPVGAMDGEGDFLPPIVESDGVQDMTPWFAKLPIVSYMGSFKKVNFALFDPGRVKTGDYDLQRNPYIHLRYVIERMSKKESHKHWKTLVEGRDCALPRPGEEFFFQGILFQDSNRLRVESGKPAGLRDSDKNLPIIIGSKTFGTSIIQAVLESFHVTDEHPVAVDAVSGRESAYVVAYNEASTHEEQFDPEVTLEMASGQDGSGDPLKEPEMSWGESLSNISGDNRSDSGAESDLHLRWCARVLQRPCVSVRKSDEESKKKRPKKLQLPTFRWARDEGLRKKVAARWRPISSLLAIPTHEEQIRMICEALADKPEIIRAAFPENSEFCNQHVLRAMANRAAMKIPESRLSDVDEDEGGLLTSDDLGMSAVGDGSAISEEDLFTKSGDDDDLFSKARGQIGQ